MRDRDEEHAIINILRYHDAQNAIVFANTRATVARLTSRLANRGLSVVSPVRGIDAVGALERPAIHAGWARAAICVATDVAARGIDLPMLDLVIHAELPTNTEGLLHPVGPHRGARAAKAPRP